MDRRTFLQRSALASASWLAPRFLQDLGHASSEKQGKILIVVQLSGGNDGLNTIIPYRNDLYYQNRPSLGIRKEELLAVDTELGLHPSLQPLRALYDEGAVSILNNVGYPNPDRSHFRSMDIWHTASDSDTYLSTGWLGRYLDNFCRDCAPHLAVEVDDSLSLAMKGDIRNGFAVSNPDRMHKAIHQPFLEAIAGQTPKPDPGNLPFLYKTLVETQTSTDYLVEKNRSRRSVAHYPSHPFGKDLKQIAELIANGSETRIYYVSLGSFDTHANQARQQARLLEQYANSMKALIEDLRHHGLFRDTLILTFSEFGRRVKQNASGGTDHGTANNTFLISGALQKPGFFNEGPDLGKLDQGDLVHQIDFRQIYAMILDQWLDVDSTTILGRKFDALRGLI